MAEIVAQEVLGQVVLREPVAVEALARQPEAHFAAVEAEVVKRSQLHAKSQEQVRYAHAALSSTEMAYIHHP